MRTPPRDSSAVSPSRRLRVPRLGFDLPTNAAYLLLGLGLASALALPSVARAESPPSRDRFLKALSYNVHGGQDARASAVARFAAEEAPDIVSLQEVPSAAWLQEFLGITGPQAGLERATPIEMGKVLVSRTPLADVKKIPLVHDRSLLRATLSHDGIEISVYAVHISWDAEGDAQGVGSRCTVPVSQEEPPMVSG